MKDRERIEAALARALDLARGPDSPPSLTAALRHAVFPGGSRLRPGLALAVARACGDDDPALADAVAAAVELLHCASLVHDDLPVFDDADTRRGRPTVHKVHGAPTALLAGDGLIVLAFEVLGRAASAHPDRLAPVLVEVARGVGAARGIVAGQAWEAEPTVSLRGYHRAKTAALFEAAAAAGAAAAGADPTPWRALGAALGEAYQLADDLYDAGAGGGWVGGKPAGADARNGRPNAVRRLGTRRTVARLYAMGERARGAVPAAAHPEAVHGWLDGLLARLAPQAEALTTAAPRSALPAPP